MLVFCRRIKGMLHSKVTDDCYICGWTSVLQFSWNGYGQMLHIAVCYTVILTPRNFITSSTC